MLVLLEAVHLREELIERLLALVVAAADARPALSSHRIDLVNEDDRALLALGLFFGPSEEITHPGRAHSHEHLHEITARDREERHIGLACDRPRQKSLACARRTHEQDAPGDLSPQAHKLLGIFQILDDLLDFFFHFIDARHIREGNL